MNAKTLIQEVTKAELMRVMETHTVWVALFSRPTTLVYVKRTKEELLHELSRVSGVPGSQALADLNRRGYRVSINELDLGQPVGDAVWIAVMTGDLGNYPLASATRADIWAQINRAHEISRSRNTAVNVEKVPL